MPSVKRLFPAGVLMLAMASPVLAHPGHSDSGGAVAPNTLSDEALRMMGLHKDRLENEVTIEVRGDYRYITANGVPDHRPGQFPNRGNPNAISAQRHSYRVPVSPEVADRPSNAMGQPFGIGLNGVPFDPGTAEFWSPGMRLGERGRTRTAWNYDALSGQINLGLDDSNAHVQPTGSYHYHGIPEGLVAIQLGEQDAGTVMVLVGYAADGFPIYSQWAHADAEDADSEIRVMTSSYRLREGQRPTGDDGPGGDYDGLFNADWEYVEGAGDLDECNGRFGVTPQYPEGTYYYVLTESFPFIPRLFKGTSDPSFERRGRPGNQGGPGSQGRPGGPGGEGTPGNRPGPRGEGDRPPRPPRGGRPPRG